jgi:predicted ABC-type exoprotein transport system permease subunit
MPDKKAVTIIDVEGFHISVSRFAALFSKLKNQSEKIKKSGRYLLILLRARSAAARKKEFRTS